MAKPILTFENGSGTAHFPIRLLGDGFKISTRCIHTRKQPIGLAEVTEKQTRAIRIPNGHELVFSRHSFYESRFALRDVMNGDSPIARCIRLRECDLGSVR